MHRYAVYRVYLKCLDELQEWIPYTKTRKKFRINVCPTFTRPQAFRFLCVDTYSPWCNQLQLKMKTPRMRVFMLVKLLAVVRYLWRRAMVRGQVCVGAHWFTCRAFWTFLVNCDFINSNSKNRTFIVNASILSKMLHNLGICCWMSFFT